MVSRTVLPGCGEAADLRPEAASRFDIEADGGLVEEDDFGVAADGETEEQTLFLASAELLKEPVFDAFELCDADDLRHAEGMRVVAAEEVDVLADGQCFWHACDLQHGTDAGARLGRAGIAVEDAGGTGGGIREAK